MKKLIGAVITISLFTILALESGQAFARSTTVNRPVTSSLCKPGNGFGDKNHCHYGPPGQVGK